MIKIKELNLKNGSRIVVIGGGPAGAFFSIFASKLAQDLGRKLDITIYEKKFSIIRAPCGTICVQGSFQNH